MGYCFLHINKVSDAGHMANLYSHNYRTKYVDNAIPELEKENEELVNTNGHSYQDIFNDRMASLGYGISKKMRKNAVKGLDILMSFSREDRDKIDIEKWKKDNVEWLRKTFNVCPEKYGDNVVSVVYHGDEVGNLHCHAFVIPIDDKGNLNASYYTDGRVKFNEYQTSYAKAMEVHGLKRGIEGSVANHETIRKFYAELNQAVSGDIPEYTKEDTLETYKQKIEDYTQTLKAVHLRELKQKDREIVEAKSLPQQDVSRMRIQKIKVEKKLEDLEREIGDLENEFGSMKEIRAKLKTTTLLNEGLKNYPDVTETARIIDEMNRIIEWQREQLRKEQEREKERKKTPYERNK